MNQSQRKLVLIGACIGSLFCVLIGLGLESAFIGILLPLALICSGLYVWLGRTKEAILTNGNSDGDIYKNYVELFESLNIETFIDALCDSLFSKDNELATVDNKKLNSFLKGRLNRVAFNNSMLLALKTTYTPKEMVALMNFHSTPEGMSIQRKHLSLSIKFGTLLKPEVEQLMEEYLESYEA